MEELVIKHSTMLTEIEQCQKELDRHYLAGNIKQCKIILTAIELRCFRLKQYLDATDALNASLAPPKPPGFDYTRY